MKPIDPEYERLYSRWSRLRELREDLSSTLFLAYSPDKKRARVSVDEIVAGLLVEASALGLDRTRFQRLARNYLSAILSLRKPTGTLMAWLTSEQERSRGAISQLPSTVEKAFDFVRSAVGTDPYLNEGTVWEGYCLLADELKQDDVEAIARSWRREWQEASPNSSADQPRDPFADEIFWDSRDFEELFNAISRYRVFERFDLEEFAQVFRDVEKMAGAHLLEAAAALGLFDPGESALPFHVRAVAIDLWLVSRTRTLPEHLSDLVALCLRGLVRSQNADGSWPSEVRIEQPLQPLDADPSGKVWRPSRRFNLDFYPDRLATALCTVCLLRLSRSEEHHERARKAVEWLLREQQPDGSWREHTYVQGSPEPASDLWTTVLASEAIARSKNSGTKRAVDRSVEWILGQQGSFGHWEGRGIPDFLLTVQILEFNRGRDALAMPLSGYFETARGLLLRSATLAQEDDPTARQLAIVAAHSGVEAFLYGLLCQPEVGISIWKDKQDTLGLRVASRKLEGHLKEKKLLAQSAILAHRNDLDSLAYIRDQVVHKASHVSRRDAIEKIAGAHSFVSEHSRSLIGRDLLLDW